MTITMILHSRAPTRISFAGGGTDLPEIAKVMGGCVTSAAITKYVYGNMKERGDKKLVITSQSSNKEEKETTDALKIEYNGHLDLIKSVAEELNIDKKGFEIALSNDLPRHSGLGVSAAAYAAVIALFDKFYNLGMTKKDIAELSFRLETEKLKNHVGKQDQYAVVFGGLNFMEFGRDMQVGIKQLKTNENTVKGLENGLALFYIAEREKTAGSAISNQVKSGSLEGFRKTKELGLKVKEALERDDLEKFGHVMAMIWKYKKMFGGVTTKFIDEIYESALEAGAYGGKISGAGGGGCGFWFCKPHKKQSVIEALEKKGAVHIPFSFDFEGVKVWED